jgi:hypothetical protein
VRGLLWRVMFVATNVALRKPRMTREEFFAWAQLQGARYEFDGFQPVAMTGASVNHNHIVRNIHRALYARLRGSGCLRLGPDDGVATIGDTVRYPDAVITCTRTLGTSYLVERPVSFLRSSAPATVPSTGLPRSANTSPLLRSTPTSSSNKAVSASPFSAGMTTMRGSPRPLPPRTRFSCTSRTSNFRCPNSTRTSICPTPKSQTRLVRGRPGPSTASPIDRCVCSEPGTTHDPLGQA